MHLGQGLLQALFTHLSETSTHTKATLLMKIKCTGKAWHRGTANKLHDTAALKDTVCESRDRQQLSHSVWPVQDLPLPASERQLSLQL